MHCIEREVNFECISINFNCQGDFIISSNGISCNQSIYIEYWDKKLLILKDNFNEIPINKERLTWEELGITNPILKNINIYSKCNIDVLIPFDKKTIINCLGSSNISISVNNIYTKLTVNIIGSGNIHASSINRPCSIGKLIVNLTGVGSVYDLYAIEKLKLKTTGTSYINITHDPGCKINKQQFGLGDIKLFPLIYV